MQKTDITIVGGGLAGLVAAFEACNRDRNVIIVDQEGPQSLGGQAFGPWAGFMVDTPEQRRMGIRDSRNLAEIGWMGSAQFDRPEDDTPRQCARAYLDFAAGPMRAFLHGLGMRWFPVVGWAERGGGLTDGHGNSVPQFHITWGTGEGIIAPFGPPNALARPPNAWLPVCPTTWMARCLTSLGMPGAQHQHGPHVALY